MITSGTKKLKNTLWILLKFSGRYIKPFCYRFQCFGIKNTHTRLSHGHFEFVGHTYDHIISLFLNLIFKQKLYQIDRSITKIMQEISSINPICCTRNKHVIPFRISRNNFFYFEVFVKKVARIERVTFNSITVFKCYYCKSHTFK